MFADYWCYVFYSAGDELSWTNCVGVMDRWFSATLSAVRNEKVLEKKKEFVILEGFSMLDNDRTVEIKRLLSTAHILCKDADNFNRDNMWMELKRIISSCSFKNDKVFSVYLDNFVVPSDIPYNFEGNKIRLSVLYKKAFDLVCDEDTCRVFHDKVEDSMSIIKSWDRFKDGIPSYVYFVYCTIDAEMSQDSDSDYVNRCIYDSEIEAMSLGFLQSMEYSVAHWGIKRLKNIYEKIKSVNCRFDTAEEFEKCKFMFTPHYRKEILSELEIYEKRLGYYKRIGRIK